jgi:excisionase family DNA binding protein
MIHFFDGGFVGILVNQVPFMPPKAKVITVGELAEHLRVHRSTLYRLLKKGQLPGFKIGGDWRFTVEEIDRWRMQPAVAPYESPPDEENLH